MRSKTSKSNKTAIVIEGEIVGLRVFPKSDEIPSNLLRFHIQFTKPVDLFSVSEHFRLVNITGGVIEPVAHPFLDLTQGLWSADGLTSTLMLHPGRIKSGLLSSALLGPSMHATRNYELQARGKFVNNQFIPCIAKWIAIKQFSVISESKLPIDLKSIVISQPRRNTRDILKIEIAAAVDYLSLKNFVAITDERNTAVPVKFKVDKSENSILATPNGKWDSGNFRVNFAEEFEDVCGNRVGSAFENVEISEARNTQNIITFSIPS